MSENHKTNLGPRSATPSTMQAAMIAMRLGISEGAFDDRAALLAPGLAFWGLHLLAPRIESFLSFHGEMAGKRAAGRSSFQSFAPLARGQWGR